MDSAITRFLKEIGSKGGKARVEKTTPEQRKKWGKMGGRPKKAKLDKQVIPTSNA